MYKAYLATLTLLVCLSSDTLGKVKLIVPLVCLVVFFFTYVFKNINVLVSSLQNKLLLLLFNGLLVLGTLRTNLPEADVMLSVYKIAVIIFFFFNTSYVLKILIRTNQAKRILELIIVPFFVLAAINILFYFIGISKDVNIEGENVSVFFSLLGLKNISRVNFFLVDGVNSYGAVNGFLLLLSMLCWYFKIFKRKICLMYGGTFLLVGLFTDSRGAIVNTLIAMGFCLMLYKLKWLKLLRFLPIIYLLAPILLFFLLPVLAKSSALNSVSRGDDLASGNSRFLIWAVVTNDYLNDEVKIFGNGEGGIYKTKSIRTIDVIFEGLEGKSGKTLIHPHNALIALILDYGMLGLFLFVCLLYSCINIMIKYWDIVPKMFTILAALLIYSMLMGVTESFIGFYYQNVLVVYFYTFYAIYAFYSEFKDQEQKNKKNLLFTTNLMLSKASVPVINNI